MKKILILSVLSILLFIVNPVHSQEPIYTPSSSGPTILSFYSSNQNLNIGDEVEFKIQVTNQGSQDEIEFILSSNKGLISIPIEKKTETFYEGETKTVTFIGSGVASGTDEICILVSGVGMLSSKDSKCISQNILEKKESNFIDSNLLIGLILLAIVCLIVVIIYLKTKK